MKKFQDRAMFNRMSLQSTEKPEVLLDLYSVYSGIYNVHLSAHNAQLVDQITVIHRFHNGGLKTSDRG